MLILASFGIYSYIHKIQWIIDNITGIVCISILFILANRLRMGRTELLLGCVSFIVHNLGTFGWYEKAWGWFSYDMIVHLVSAFAVAWIAMNYLSKKIKVFEPSSFKKLFVLFFLAISITALLGTVVELIEFYGFIFFGPGEGMFFAGPGDTKFVDDIIGNYMDTMIDIVVNVIGSIIGAFAYLFIRHK